MMKKELTSEMSLSEVFDIITTNNVKEVDNYGLWYDWFCSTKSLANRGVNLLTKLKSIKSSTKFDKEKTYIFFKNNCPVGSPTYDDFRICDKATSDVIYTVVPRDSVDGKAKVYGQVNGVWQTEPIVEGKWIDVKKFFNED